MVGIQRRMDQKVEMADQKSKLEYARLLVVLSPSCLIATRVLIHRIRVLFFRPLRRNQLQYELSRDVGPQREALTAKRAEHATTLASIQGDLDKIKKVPFCPAFYDGLCSYVPCRCALIVFEIRGPTISLCLTE